MAKEYLTVQGCSVLSEWVFSSGTGLVNADRCSLHGKTFEMAPNPKIKLIIIEYEFQSFSGLSLKIKIHSL
jgi:hypothetical protein